MKRFMTALLLAAFLILPLSALAEIKTITHTVQQPFGGSQSPDDARTAGIARAKREALEQFGTYIESTTVVKDSQVDSDEILALTAGVTKAEVIKQKNYTDGDGFGLEITVKVELDTSVLEKSLKRLLADRDHLKDLKAARDREKKLLARVAELEKENRQKKKTKQQSAKLKKEFKAASEGLTAVGWFDKAFALWDGNKLSDPKRVIEYLTQAIRLEPDAIGAYINRGHAYSVLKQFDLAIADFDQAIRLEPNDAMAFYNRGITYSALKQFDRAIVDYDQAIRLEPNDPKGYGERGRAFADLKLFDRAIADYSQAISLDPYYAARYYNRGNAYKTLNHNDLAIADYDQAIRLDPNLAVAYINRGNAYGLLNQLDRAISDADHAIRLDPNMAKAYITRGAVFFLLNKNNQGCADLEKACTMGLCDSYDISRQQKLCR